jgi:hypothetical protein
MCSDYSKWEDGLGHSIAGGQSAVLHWKFVGSPDSHHHQVGD